MKKAKIGLLGIMQELYDDSLPGITERQEKFAKEVIGRFEAEIDFEFPKAARNRDDVEQIVKDFNYHDLDGIMVVNLTYGPACRTIKAWERNSLPVLLANIQPEEFVSAEWNMDHLTYNQGIHGAQDTANALLRSGTFFEVISANWRSPEFKTYIYDWSRACKAANVLSSMKVAGFGKMHGMGDTLSDEAAFTRIIGPEVNREYIGEIYKELENISDEEIRDQMEIDRKNFLIDENMPQENHAYAVRLMLAFKKYLDTNNYSAFSPHFDVFKADGRFQQIPMLAASNLMAAGYGYAAEGDTNTASMVAAGHVLDENAHFTEMYAMDFRKGSMLMSHMGEGNWKIARKDQLIRLAHRRLDIGNLDNPPTAVFMAEPGPATIVSLVHVEGEYFKLVTAYGEILDTESVPCIEMPYFHFKPSSGLASCNDNWLRNGGTHHQTLLLGDQRRKWQFLCSILGIEYVEV